MHYPITKSCHFIKQIPQDYINYALDWHVKLKPVLLMIFRIGLLTV